MGKDSAVSIVATAEETGSSGGPSIRPRALAELIMRRRSAYTVHLAEGARPPLRKASAGHGSLWLDLSRKNE